MTDALLGILASIASTDADAVVAAMKTGNDWAAPGLSMYHISPQKAGETSTKRPEPKITFWQGASLVSAELGKPSGGNGKRHTWTRGEITKFSKSSRRRILRIVATIKRDETPIFSTKTYPDNFPVDPQEYKRHLDNFYKRLLRKHPDAIILWRMEPQRRKSGENIGKIAPHIHDLIWGVSYQDLRDFTAKNWYEVVGSGDERHLRAGTRVEKVRSVKGVLFYTSKYICKSLNFELPGWGRYWGVINRKLFKTIQGEKLTIDTDAKTILTILRYMRRKASEVHGRGGRYIGRRKFPKWGSKFTLIGDADFWKRSLPKIQENCQEAP